MIVKMRQTRQGIFAVAPQRLRDCQDVKFHRANQTGDETKSFPHEDVKVFKIQESFHFVLEGPLST